MQSINILNSILDDDSLDWVYSISSLGFTLGISSKFRLFSPHGYERFSINGHPISNMDSKIIRRAVKQRQQKLETKFTFRSYEEYVRKINDRDN